MLGLVMAASSFAQSAADKLKAKLAELESLRATNVLTPEEYQAARREAIRHYSTAELGATPAPSGGTVASTGPTSMPPGFPGNAGFTGSTLTGPTPPIMTGGNGPLIIEALIDGPSTLHITPTGIYWENGGPAKPGRHAGKREPTYVNGQPWQPVWKKGASDYGVDTSEVLQIKPPLIFSALNKPKTVVEIKAITRERGLPGYEERSPLEVSATTSDVAIKIPDLEGDSRWYTLAIDKGAILGSSLEKSPMGGSPLNRPAYDQKKGVAKPATRVWYIQ